jgi:ribokinase
MRKPSNSSPSIVVVGGANTDYLVRGDRLPQPGETVQGGEFEPADAGGKGANQAVAAARLGARVAFIGRVGVDDRGRILLQRLEAEGVEVRHVVKDRRASTGVALIHVGAEGEKQILVAPGANLRLTTADVRRASGTIQCANVLVLQFEVPMKATLAAARIAHRARVPIVLDPAPAAKPPGELLRLVHVIRPNEHEAEELTGVKVRNRATARRAAERLIELGPRAAIVAGGSGGNLLVWRNDTGNLDEIWLPKLPVKTIDATGAGDAFAAGIAVALSEKRSFPEAAVFANAAGALATTKIGAQPAMPTRKAVEALLRRTGSKAEARSFSTLPGGGTASSRGRPVRRATPPQSRARAPR